MVQLHNPNGLQRSTLFGNDLGGIKNIESISENILFLDDLDIELPLRPVSRLDCFPEVVAVIVCILARDVLSFVPNKAGLALLSLPMPFDELRVSVFCYKTESVDAKSILSL